MKKVLITGGTRGIGLACVKAFAEAGYDTAITYKNSNAEANDIHAKYGTAAYPCDLESKFSIMGAIKRMITDFPEGFDVIINNAGISSRKMMCDISDKEWDDMIAVNLTAPFIITRELSPFMVRKGSGRIINISSVWGEHGASCEVHYSAAKAGLIGLTKASAMELAPSGVLVNCICPGVIDTDMNNDLSDDEKTELKESIPLSRFGTPEDVAKTALFLASESSGYMIGQILTVDGGFCN